MNKEQHLEFLKQKYIELSRQYLHQMQQGKTKEELQDLADVINVLIKEIEELENDSNNTQ